MNFFKTKISEANEEFEAMKVDFNTLEVEHENLKAELVASQEAASNFQAQLETLRIEKEALESQLSQLQLENETVVSAIAETHEVAAEIAAEIVAEAGVPPVEITEDTPKKTVLDQFNSLTGEERHKFYNDNKAEIFKLLK